MITLNGIGPDLAAVAVLIIGILFLADLAVTFLLFIGIIHEQQLFRNRFPFNSLPVVLRALVFERLRVDDGVQILRQNVLSKSFTEMSVRVRKCRLIGLERIILASSLSILLKNDEETWLIEFYFKRRRLNISIAEILSNIDIKYQSACQHSLVLFLSEHLRKPPHLDLHIEAATPHFAQINPREGFTLSEISHFFPSPISEFELTVEGIDELRAVLQHCFPRVTEHFILEHTDFNDELIPEDFEQILSRLDEKIEDCREIELNNPDFRFAYEQFVQGRRFPLRQERPF